MQELHRKENQLEEHGLEQEAREAAPAGAEPELRVAWPGPRAGDGFGVQVEPPDFLRDWHGV